SADVVLNILARQREPVVAAGKSDGSLPPTPSLILMPAMILGVGLLLLYIPQIDPLRANVDRFRGSYNWIIIGMSAFMLFMHVLTLLAGLGVQFNILYLMIPAMALLFIGMGFVVERAKPNWFIGIRTPWTLSSPTVWEKTHRLGGLLFKISGVLMLLGLLFPPEVGFYFGLVPLMVSAFGSVIYSYIAYRAEQH
ncbi:MAG TPA: SdpI family protein, partial [Anaerolinea sp.]|nr:SdpI family protein [Anaerolinea sp.]